MSSVAVLSFSPIARDARVLRQCALLQDMGHLPHVIGYADPDETIPYTLSSRAVPRPTTINRLRRVARQVPSHMGLSAARLGFWVEPSHRWALQELQRLSPRLVLANDWPALVVAAAWKATSGGLIHFDVHEFATQEFEESLWWRIVYKPMVTHLEKFALASADSVSTVGPSLAAGLKALYNLDSMPLVVRSTPERTDVQQNPDCGWPLRVLFHGHLLPGRGLESLIRSVSLWNEPHTLVIRGNVSNTYLASLKALANGLPSDQVQFEPVVEQKAVISTAAATADIGVFFTPLRTGQQNFNLPNKIFEYIAAGLALAVSPAPDIHSIIEEFGVGVVSTNADPEAIANVINSLTKEKVVAYKAAARSASLELCWEKESKILRSALERLLNTGANTLRNLR